MKLVFNFLDNVVDLKDDKVLSIEVENKTYFYRIVNTLVHVSNGELLEDLTSFDDDSEINLSSKINVIIDYFNIEELFKKYHTNIIKFISNNIDINTQSEIINKYIIASKSLNKQLLNIDMPLVLQNELSFDNILKFMKVDIEVKENFLDNLFLLIDIEKELKVNKLLVFVNLKQYLNKEEIEELYKYSIYNKVKILMIDSFYNDILYNFENKLHIDRDLEEYMIE